MCKSAMYAANRNTQSVAIGGLVDFGSIVRRFGQNVSMSGGSAVVKGSGYYSVDVNVTFTASGAGPVVIEVLKDGEPIPGAVTTRTTAAATIYALTIPVMIRNSCCKEAVIDVRVSGENVSVNNAAIVVEKL